MEGVSTRRVEGLVQALGREGISKSQVSRICQELDAMADSFLGHPLDGWPYPYLWLDALNQKVREDGTNRQCERRGGHRVQSRREASGAWHRRGDERGRRVLGFVGGTGPEWGGCIDLRCASGTEGRHRHGFRSGVVRRGWQGQQGLQVPLHPLADTLRVAPEPGVHARQAAPLQVGIQRLEALEGRYGHQKVAAHVAHHALHLPLVAAGAGDILEEARCLGTGSGLVFPSQKGKPLSNMAFTMVLRRLNDGDAVPHSFRSTFKGWTLEQTVYPWAVVETALAHTLGSATESAYARSDLFDRRR